MGPINDHQILHLNRFSYISQISDNRAFWNCIQQTNSDYDSVIYVALCNLAFMENIPKIQNLVKRYTRNHCIALSEEVKCSILLRK